MLEEFINEVLSKLLDEKQSIKEKNLASKGPLESP